MTQEPKLYVVYLRLYTTVLSTIKGFGNLFWVDVVAQIDAMNEQVQGFQAQFKKLPKVRSCHAFLALHLPTVIRKNNEILPARKHKEAYKDGVAFWSSHPNFDLF